MKKNQYKHIYAVAQYLHTQRWRLVFLLAVFVLLDFLSRLPYFSLLLTFTNVTIIFWIVVMFVLKLPSKSSFFVAIIFLFFAIINALRNRSIAQEVAGNIIYFLLLIGFIGYFRDFLKRLRKTHEKT